MFFLICITYKSEISFLCTNLLCYIWNWVECFVLGFTNNSTKLEMVFLAEEEEQIYKPLWRATSWKIGEGIQMKNRGRNTNENPNRLLTYITRILILKIYSFVPKSSFSPFSFQSNKIYSWITVDWDNQVYFRASASEPTSPTREFACFSD